MKFKGIRVGILALSTLSLLLTSATPENSNSNEYELKVGDKLPVMKTKNESFGEMFKIKDGESKLLLVNFWKSYDSNSRFQNHIVNEYIKSNPQSKIEFRSIALEEDKDIYDISLRIDKIDSLKSIQISKGIDEIEHLYDLKSGVGSFLIDEAGNILAVNPTLSEIEKLDK